MKNLEEIIKLCEEEINNNDKNVSAVLDLTDLKELKELLEDYNELNNDNETNKNKIYELEDKIDSIQENSILDLDNFIWKLKSDNLYTSELEDFIENYMKFYNK